MARIAGINIPLNKRVEVGLTYIFGIGRSTSTKLLDEAGDLLDTRVGDLTEDEVVAPAQRGRRPDGRGRPAPRALPEHQAPAWRSAATAASATAVGCPCAASAPRPTRAPARARAGCRSPARRRRPRSSECPLPADPASGRRRVRKNIPRGPGPHQDQLQQHDRVAHRPRGQRDRLGVRRRRRLQGLAQVHALRGAGDRRRRRPQGHGAGPAEGRRVRPRPRLGSRDRDPLAPGSRPRGDVRPRRHALKPTTAAARGSGGGSNHGARHRAAVQAVPPRGAEAVPQGRALPHRQVRRRAPLVSARRPRSRAHAPERVPRPAAREAEGAPLLRREREAVPHLLRQGHAPARRDRREPAADAREPARQRARPARLRRVAAPGAPARLATATGRSTAAASTSRPTSCARAT